MLWAACSFCTLPGKGVDGAWWCSRASNPLQRPKAVGWVRFPCTPANKNKRFEPERLLGEAFSYQAERRGPRSRTQKHDSHPLLSADRLQSPIRLTLTLRADVRHWEAIRTTANRKMSERQQNQ